MWIHRDFKSTISKLKALPIKVLKGPRQVGKTSFLERLNTHRIVYFDDLAARSRASENPRLFLSQLDSRVILDECSLAPAIFPELKRLVDQARREGSSPPDIWITGSNQTLLQRSVRESLAGRANYFDLNTLSIHELGSEWSLKTHLLRGGWPELYVNKDVDSRRYLADLIATFVEKDIVAAAGIERKAAFSKTLQLLSGRVGQLLNVSDIARSVGVDSTTVNSWVGLLEENGLLRRVQPYFTNLNKRLIKTPKIFFEDVALASHLQGWSAYEPLASSPYFGHLVENIALSEILRFFQNRAEIPKVYYLRSKEQVEVDFLIELPNQRYLAAEVKNSPQDFKPAQRKLLDSLQLNIIAHWIISPTPSPAFQESSVVTLDTVWDELSKLF